MPIDYRLDPFQDVLNVVTISGETHTIPSVSPFTIRLDEVPLKETPSSISLTIGGVRAEEVSSAPAPGQFWPDYSTGADGDDDWNTGTILFNASDAGKTVVVTYKGTGVLVASETLKTHVFTSSGTITAPSWATHAIVSGCAGGGGGGGSGGGQGTTGGTTSFGDLLTLTGGIGGTAISGTGEGTGAAGGNGYSGLAPATGAVGSSRTGMGGGNPFGAGAAARGGVSFVGSDGIGYGSGGGGASANATNGIKGNGGGSGGACVELRVAIEPGKTYTVTIGAGGMGGSGVYIGGKGAPGILMIRWARM